MAQGQPPPKFERNPCIKFRDNCDTDGRTTDGGRTNGRLTNFDFMSSADIVKQSLKSKMFSSSIAPERVYTNPH